MKNITRLSTLLLLILWLTACEDTNIEPVDSVAEISCEEQPLGCNLAEANSEFAIDLWQQINEEEEEIANIFISPFSITTALTMTMNGAANTTYEQMETTLHTDHFARTERNYAFQSLLTSLPNLDEKVALE
ncbi:MAG: serpin family protein, partial [Saprospiraceae bacterium]